MYITDHSINYLIGRSVVYIGAKLHLFVLLLYSSYKAQILFFLTFSASIEDFKCPTSLMNKISIKLDGAGKLGVYAVFTFFLVFGLIILTEIFLVDVNKSGRNFRLKTYILQPGFKGFLNM